MDVGPRVVIGRDADITIDASTVEVRHGTSIGAAVVLNVNAGTLVLGADTHIFERCLLESYGGELGLGARCHISRGCVLSAGRAIRVGDGSQVGEYVSIRDHDHIPGMPPSSYARDVAAVTIGSDVWLGAKVTVTRGVTIGDGAVAGANAVVTRDVPVRSLALGVPARVTRTFD